MAKITTPDSLYGNSRDILREAERENEILADIAGEEYESPGDIPKGKYVIEKRLLDAAQKKNELLEAIAEGSVGSGAAKAIGIDYATDIISLKNQDGDVITGSGATLPAYGVSFDPTTGGLTLTKNGTAMQGQTVTIPNYGSPVGVTDSADMVDEGTIYLYEGETGGGFTNGHFYYYDGTAWADGGEYAAATVQTDKTLLVEDRAADAKATGEAVGELKTQIDDVNNAYGDIQISKQFPANSRYSNYDIPLLLPDRIDCIVCLLSLNSENFQTCIIYGYDGSNYNELGRIASVGGYTKFTIPSTITTLRIGLVLTANDANKPIWKGWVLFSDKNGTNNVLFDEIISLNGNLQSKIGNSDLPFVTPQMYGAVGDGVNDDTTAFQNAIDSGKRVLVPEGQYMVSAPLVISKQGTIIEGVNNRSWGTYKQCAELTLKSGVYMDAFIQLTGNANNTVIKNLVMWGNTTSYQPSSGIFYNSTDSEFVSDIVIENVIINYCGFGINIDSIFKSLFSNVRIANCRQYGFKLSGKTSGEYASDGTTLTLINCYALYCARSYTFERIRYSSLINCASDACTVYDYSLKTCSGVSFINCGCEQSKGNPFFMQGTNQGVSITGFEVIALDELSSGLEDALISCYGMVNCVISGITIASVIKRDVEILNKSPAYTSISVLDNSINPAKCDDISDGCIRFLAREIVYTNLASPDFAGQIRMGNNSVEIGVNNNGTLEWASLLN